MTYSIWSLTPESLAWTFATTALLTALVLLVRRPVARGFGANWAYALWAVPFARLVLPPLRLPAEWTAQFGGGAATETAHSHAVAATAPPLTDMPAMATAPLIQTETIPPLAGLPWATALLSLWIIGTCLAIGLLIWRHMRFMRTVSREVRPVDAALAETSAQIAGAIGYKGRAVICTSLISSGPMVTGLIRPVVLLPEWFAEDYSPTQQRAAIAHELTHAKRGDLWALQAAQIFVALQWFNPLAYLALRAFRSDQEAACDANVLNAGVLSPRDYGHALLFAARMTMPRHSPALAAGLPMTHSLKERLTLMQNPPPSLTRRISGAALLALLGVAACTSAAIAGPATSHTETRTITITDGKIEVDGKTYHDRTMVLLDDPFAGTGPDMQALEGLIELKVLGALEGLEDLAELEKLEHLHELEILSEQHGTSRRIIIESHDDKDVHLEVDVDEEGRQIVRMNGEVVSEEDVGPSVSEDGRHVISVTRKGQVIVRQGGSKDVIIHRMEEGGQNFPHKIVRRFSNMDIGELTEATFEDEMEDATLILASLVDTCVAHQFTGNAPKVLTQKSEVRGQTYSSLCINRNGMSGDEITVWLDKSGNINDAQMQAFLDQQDSDDKTTWKFRRELDGGKDQN